MSGTSGVGPKCWKGNLGDERRYELPGAVSGRRNARETGVRGKERREEKRHIKNDVLVKEYERREECEEGKRREVEGM